ncbi:MAG: phytoene desaturase family protein [Gammaproteobacteria bacterium]
MKDLRIAIIGAGIGGLSAALALVSRGAEVTVLERAAQPGGKVREVAIGDSAVASGPTVFTMRPVFDEIFAEAGADFTARVVARPAEILARHAWSTREQLDLYADLHRSAAAIGELAGPAEARRYLAFCAAARKTFDTLERTFIRAQRPTPLSLVQRTAAVGMHRLLHIRPFTTLWAALQSHFNDPRLRQLFGRYATYCGSSPYEAPATLMLVAHVEQEGVWLLDDGIQRLAEAMRELAVERGATFRFGTAVAEIELHGGRASAVIDSHGERQACDAVVCNADPAALASGHFGAAVRAAMPGPPRRQRRSLSSLTWSIEAPTQGFALLHHNVFFSRDYRREFDDIFRRGRVPFEPTVYVCAQDRGRASATPEPGANERLFCLVNAPAVGDTHEFGTEEVEQCATRTFSVLKRCGLEVARDPERTVVTTPSDFERMFPATGGALYGQASHGWRASFDRPAASTRIPGLYLAGGGTHPGPGVPMAAVSGRLAAQQLLADQASTGRWRRAAMPGGTSMP